MSKNIEVWSLFKGEGVLFEENSIIDRISEEMQNYLTNVKVYFIIKPMEVLWKN